MALEPGTRIGRFEIAARLGAGGMGEVYQAFDNKLHREVALKLLSPALAMSEEHLLRFEREARAASALNHPHICTIYDVGHATEVDGRPYIVMELLRGQTVSEMLDAGPAPLATVIRLGVQIADALGAAHAAGIVHRDIKPANIFVTQRGDAKLLDFGLATVLLADKPDADGHLRPHTALTDPGTALGTVSYMSPEQALGDPVDHRTDLFSFALVLYEMITGRRAFEGRSNAAIMDAILHDTPPGLDSEGPSAVPRALVPMLRRALAKNRELRPASAAEMAAHLRALQSGSVAGREFAAATPLASGSTDSLKIKSDVFRAAPPFSPTKEPPSSGGRMRLVDQHADLIAGAIAIVLALAGYAGYRWYAGSQPPIGSREPLLLADFANTTDEGVFDGALKDALEIQLRQSPYLNVLPVSQVRTALRSMGKAADERVTSAVARDLCQRLGAKAILLGSIAPLGSAYVIGLDAQECLSGDTLAREQIQAASKTEVLPAVGAAAARFRERLGESLASIQRFNVPVQNATTPSLEALKAYSLGLETRARTGDAQAIAVFEHALELDPNFALAAARLGSIFSNLHDVQQAQRYMKRAYGASETLSEPERLFIKANYHYIVTGRLEEVIATYQLWAQTYPNDWIPHNNLSSAYYRVNRLDEALAEARVALGLGNGQIVPYQQLARTLLAMDRAGDAKAVLHQAEEKGFDSSFNRALLYRLAFLERDTAAMQQHLQAASTRADGYLVVAEAARAAAASGALERSRTLYAQAIEGAKAAHIHDYAGSLMAEQALAEALLGERDAARRDMYSSVEIGEGPDTLWMASLAASFSGLVPQAMELAGGYAQVAPPAPDVVATLRPILEAAVSLAGQEGKGAIAALSGADPFARASDPWVPYLRGLAQVALQDHERAIVQFRAALTGLERQPPSVVHPLARLQLARTFRAMNNLPAAREEYARVVSAWQDGDAGHRFVAAAMDEAAAIGSPDAAASKAK